MTNHLIDKRDEYKLKVDLSCLTQLYVSSSKPSSKDIMALKVLRNLRKNIDIVVRKPDKDNEVVVLNRKDYTKCILDIINDEHKFIRTS